MYFRKEYKIVKAIPAHYWKGQNASDEEGEDNSFVEFTDDMYEIQNPNDESDWGYVKAAQLNETYELTPEEEAIQTKYDLVLDELEIDLDSPAEVEEGHMIKKYIINHPEASVDEIVELYNNYTETGDTTILENKKLNLKTYLDSMEMVAIPLRFEQQRVLKSMLPIFDKQVIEDRIGTIMPSPTMACMYPFIFDSLKDEGLSTLLGVEFSGGVVLFNQFLYQIRKENNRNNANMIILGASGSGKSTAAKLMIRSHIRNDYQLVCVDPEGELTEMTKNYGGEVIDLGKGGQYGMINPLEIVMDSDDDQISNQGLGYTVLTSTLQTLKAFMKYYSPNIEEDVLTLFGEIALETYARFGIAYNTNFSHYKSKDFPRMQDVYVTVTSKLTSMTEKTHERDVLERLELKLRPLVKELQYYFNGYTTIDTSNDYLVFNIKEIMNSDVNVRNALLFNVLKYAWSLCLNPNKNTVLSVDEAHVLLGSQNELGAEFLAQVQRRARKYNTGTIIITQQPSDFVASNMIMHGKAIFDNASYYLVMGLRKQAADDLSLLIDLNDNERENIKRYNQGEALFVCGNRRMQIDVTLTDKELESFGSGGGL